MEGRRDELIRSGPHRGENNLRIVALMKSDDLGLRRGSLDCFQRIREIRPNGAQLNQQHVGPILRCAMQNFLPITGVFFGKAGRSLRVREQVGDVMAQHLALDGQQEMVRFHLITYLLPLDPVGPASAGMAGKGDGFVPGSLSAPTPASESAQAFRTSIGMVAAVGSTASLSLGFCGAAGAVPFMNGLGIATLGGLLPAGIGRTISGVTRTRSSVFVFWICRD